MDRYARCFIQERHNSRGYIVSIIKRLLPRDGPADRMRSAIGGARPVSRIRFTVIKDVVHLIQSF